MWKQTAGVLEKGDKLRVVKKFGVRFVDQLDIVGRIFHFILNVFESRKLFSV